MLLRAASRWVPLALALSLVLSACVQDDIVRPHASPSALSADLAANADFFASPTGSPSGDGSFANPWDLATALSGPAAVTSGSTIWLRGGTYADPVGGFSSTLTGTADAPIVVRQYPGEHATVTNALVVRGAYTWFWGLEIANPAQLEAHGVDVWGPGTKLIDLVVHDATESGLFIRPEASNTETYGSIIYNNGRTDNLDHGIYCQSATSMLLQDNIVFDNWAYGIHCYTQVEGYLQNIRLQGNVAFNNYVWGVPADADLLVGGEVPATGIIVDQNYTYRTNNMNTQTADVGYNTAVNNDVAFTNNYFAGGWLRVGSWGTATVSGNTLYNFTSGGMVWALGDLGGQAWSDNTFFGDSTAPVWRYNDRVATFADWRTLTGFADPGTYAGSAPTGVKIVVRPNQYEPGRANIVVYNWAQPPQSTVSVDVSGVLHVGDRYVVQNSEDFYGPPIAGGTYTGGALQLPMVSITPPSPLGVVTTQPAPVTGPTFDVYVLMRTKPDDCTPDERGSVESCTDWHDRSDPPSRGRAHRVRR